MASGKSVADEEQRPNIIKFAFSILLPGFMMPVSIGFFLITALLNPGLLIPPDVATLQDKSFASFWGVLGKMFATDFPSDYLDPILASVRGTVLDVGPGTGAHVHRFASKPSAESEGIQTRKAASDDSKLASRVIWAVEPGTDMHAALEKSALAAGFGRGLIRDKDRSPQGQYKILGCGAQPAQLIPALCDAGVCEWIGKDKKSASAEEVFDAIVTVRVLCGVPDQEATIDGLYRLLKPGGQWIVFEHVVNSGDPTRGGSSASRFMQKLWMTLGWSFWGGGCCLDRDTKAVMERAANRIDGGWAKVETHPRKPWSAVPEIYGVFTKKH